MKVYQILVEYIANKLNRPFTYYFDGDIEIFSRVLVPFNNKDIVGFVINKDEIESLDEYQKKIGLEIKGIKEVIDDEPLINEELFSLANEISSYYLCPLISVIFVMLPPSLKPSKSSLSKTKTIFDTYVEAVPNASYHGLTTKQAETLYRIIEKQRILKRDLSLTIVNNLLKKNKVRLINIEKNRLLLEKGDYQIHPLNEEQEKAYYEFINSQDQTYLLYGVTGSGKTEIYLKLTEYYLFLKKRVLILVPEIALSYLMVQRFTSQNWKIAILHSALNDGERYDVYRDIKKNHYDVVIGTRSAIFAPINDLGLIIIDEEQSENYKQEDILPYYNAINVAKMRLKDGKVLLGSATPSLESKARALKNNYHELILKKRVNDLTLPDCFIVDMTNYRNIDKTSHLISIPLRMMIKQNLEKKEQVILMVNRRGYAPFVSCKKCGEVIKCPECQIALTYHYEVNKLICHHCGYEQEMVLTCPKCHSGKIYKSGFGTEKVVEEVKRLFPDAKVIRLDSDVAKRRNGIKDTLDKFNNHEADILVGTQLIAKGHDFPDTTLAAVVLADLSLNLPTFKANEKTFSLLTQVIGRSGRRKKGKAVIQTYLKDNFVINLACKQDYDTFFKKELHARYLLQNPPYTFLTLLIVSSESEKEAINGIENIKKYLIFHLDINNVDILGPSKMFLNKYQNRYRRKIILKYKSFDLVRDVLLTLQEIVSSQNKFSLTIDVDPEQDY